jgi:hypothetical protein
LPAPKILLSPTSTTLDVDSISIKGTDINSVISDSIELKVSKINGGGRNYVLNGDVVYSSGADVQSEDVYKTLSKPYSYFAGKTITMSFDYTYDSFTYSSSIPNRMSFSINPYTSGTQ